MHDVSRDFSAHWSSGATVRSPLLMLGGSVVAAVMLIGTGLSMLGTEAADPAGPASRYSQPSPAAQRAAVTVTAVAELKTLQVAVVETR